MSAPLPWAAALSDDCTCKWSNSGDNTGWELKAWRRDCPVHQADAGPGSTLKGLDQ